jgi:hypothetical protein
MKSTRVIDPIRPLCNSETAIVNKDDDVENEDEKELPDLLEDDPDDDDGGNEARKVKALRDPGAPTQIEIDLHNVTHLPFRPWCPSCVSGQGKDKHHKQMVTKEKTVDEVVFDYGFLGSEGVKETLPVQVSKYIQCSMIFAHAVPRKGLADDHGVDELVKDLEKLGLKKMILKSDGEAALKHIQEEVRRRREEETILENSPVGDSRSNGHAERAVQSIVGLVRTMKNALENRTNLKLDCNHAVIPWIIEHASDTYNKFHVCADGKTPYEKWKGKSWDKETLELCELVHYRFSKKNSRGKLDDRWDEGIFLGYHWRTGEANIGTTDGVIKAGTIRRTGAHRRWDADRVVRICGSPWKPIVSSVAKEKEEPKIRWLTEDEKNKGIEVREEDLLKPGRVRLLKEDYVEHGFTSGCKGCKSIINQERAQTHSEECRKRMEKKLEESEVGKNRKRKAEEKSNEWIAQKMKISEDAPVSGSACGSKRPMVPEESSSSSSDVKKVKAPNEEGKNKRNLDEESANENLKRRKSPEEQGHKRTRDPDPLQGRPNEDDALDSDYLEQLLIIDECPRELNIMEEFLAKRCNVEPERYVFDPSEWEVLALSDMCQAENFGNTNYDQVYYDETTWEQLDPVLVDKGEKEEMTRFRNRQVYSYVDRAEAMNDREGKFVKVKWVRINKGSRKVPNVRCRLVAQELGYGVKDDELYAGTPSLSTLKLLLAWYCTCWNSDDVVKVIDVKCAFLYGKSRRKIYIELPVQDDMAGGEVVGLLDKAMYGTRDAPLIWQATVDELMKRLGFESSMLQPGVYFFPKRSLRIMIHVDDFLVIGSAVETSWFEQEIRKEFDITCKTLGRDFEHEIKYLNRDIRWTPEGLELEGHQKHVQILLTEWGMVDCRGVETPVARDGEEKDVIEVKLSDSECTRYRRGAARVNYISQDRPDLSTASRRLAQGMSVPSAGDELRLKRVLRYLKTHPRCVSKFAWQDKPSYLTLLVDSDWAGCKTSRKSCSGGSILYGSHLIAHWSKLQSNVALSSGEAELNAAVKGVSEAIGIQELCAEVGQPVSVWVGTDASVCKSILLRHGAGKIKHLTTKQLWIQGAIEAFGMKICKIPRAENSADLMTHGCTIDDFLRHLERLHQDTGRKLDDALKAN